MADGDRRTTIGNGLPRIAEISRAVTHGIRGLAEITGAPSFAERLASASASVDGDDDDVTRGGQKPDGLTQPGDSLMARPGRDRAVGSAPGTTFEPLTHASLPRVSAPALPQHGAPYQGTAYASILSPTASASSDLSAATRATSSLATTQPTSNRADASGLALEAYPKPSRADRAGVLNWTSAAPPTGRDLDRFLAEARERKVGWVTFVADPERIDAYGDLADRLTKAGIQPIARIEDPEGDMPVRDVNELVKELRGHGVRYFQLFDDANVAEQTPDYRTDVQDYAQRWLAAAKAVVAGGGLPGIGALSPDGDYDDLGFMRQLLSQIQERGGTDVLGQSWLALRGETPGAAATKADVGDLASRAEWFDRVNRQTLGRSLPILASLDPAGRAEPLTAEANPAKSAAPVEQTERALRDSRRKLPALFAASRGSLEARRA